MTTDEFLTILRDRVLADLDAETLAAIRQTAVELIGYIDSIIEDTQTDAKLAAFEDAFGGEE